MWWWAHPDDLDLFRELSRQMETGPATAVVRLGRWPDLRPCRLECTKWRLGGAAISLRSLPEPELCGVAVTDADRYIHVDGVAQELLGASSLELEGQPWGPRVHPLDVIANEDKLNRLYTGRGEVGPVAALIRAEGSWKLMQCWSKPDGGGRVLNYFKPLAASSLMGRPLASMVAAGMRYPRSAAEWKSAVPRTIAT